MNVNTKSAIGIAAIIIAILLPIAFSFIEYVIAKHCSERAMFILPIVILSTAFVIRSYGIIFAAIVLSVGFITRHIRKKKLSELKKMSTEDLNENKK